MKCKSCWISIVTRFILVEHINDTLNRSIFASTLVLNKINNFVTNFFYFSNFYHNYY